MTETVDVLIIGGGPAGLMAAEAAAQQGVSVLLADAMPTVGRKFLMAGKSGLNLTKDEDSGAFLAAYGPDADQLAPHLTAFGPRAAIDWANGLGQDVFTGSTGRVFPKAMKASPLLRAWISRLTAVGVVLRNRWRFAGWDGAAAQFDTPDGPTMVQAGATVLAMGGASWPRLGSDGSWVHAVKALGAETRPFAASNAAISVDWSDHMARHFGSWVKASALTCGDTVSRGEFVISPRGLEGGGVYGLSRALRLGFPLTLNLLPDLDPATAVTRLEAQRNALSGPEKLRRAMGFAKPKLALAQEFGRPLPSEPAALVARLQSLTVPHRGMTDIAGAISTVGGLPWSALGPDLNLVAAPGVFAAGEMIDWDAPTGGYLLTACLATGRAAGAAAATHAIAARN